jgi:exodeoxyribonuclease-3
MRIATWNVNSLKARLPRVEEWLGYAQPDVLCMQETKLADGAFPAMAFQGLGYDSASYGDGRWNGVAILSRVGLDDVTPGFSVPAAPERGDGDDAGDDAGDPVECRLISATCGGVRVSSIYVPNGRSVDSEHYQFKLRWLSQLRRQLEATSDPDTPVVVCGDYNIAPEDRDVYDPAKFVGATHVSDAERAALRRLEDWGLVDAFRIVYGQERLYSWWDYRAGDFHEGRGMRIDLMLVTKPLAERVRYALIDRNARKGKLPSDHAPFFVDFADLAEA